MYYRISFNKLFWLIFIKHLTRDYRPGEVVRTETLLGIFLGLRINLTYILQVRINIYLNTSVNHFKVIYDWKVSHLGKVISSLEYPITCVTPRMKLKEFKTKSTTNRLLDRTFNSKKSTFILFDGSFKFNQMDALNFCSSF